MHITANTTTMYLQLCRDPKVRMELFQLSPEGFDDDPRMFLVPTSARMYHKEIVKLNTRKTEKTSTSAQPDKPDSAKPTSTTQGVTMEVDKPTSVTQSLVDTMNKLTAATQGVTSTQSLSQSLRLTQLTTLRNKASTAAFQFNHDVHKQMCTKTVGTHDLGHKNKGNCYEKVTIATSHTPGHTCTPVTALSKPVKQTSQLNSQPHTPTSHDNQPKK